MKLRLAAIAICLASATAWGHHSLAAEFDQKKPVKLTGALTKLDWRNPHAWIYLDAKTADGKIEKWAVRIGIAERDDASRIQSGFRKNRGRNRSGWNIGEGWRKCLQHARSVRQRRQHFTASIGRWGITS